jgi:type I restriction enzyme, S subunit
MSTLSFGKIEDKCLIGDGAHASIVRQNGGVLYLTAKNFTQNGLDLTQKDYISETDYEGASGIRVE